MELDDGGGDVPPIEGVARGAQACQSVSLAVSRLLVGKELEGSGQVRLHEKLADLGRMPIGQVKLSGRRPIPEGLDDAV